MKVSDEAAIQEKQAALRVAEAELADTNVAAPAKGTIVSRHVAVGQVVAPTAEAPALFTIAGDMAQMNAVARIPERDAGEIKPGDEASFTIGSLPGRSFAATVAEVRLTRTTQYTATYEALLQADNSKMALKPGMAVTARIVTARREDVLRAPDAAFDFVPKGIATPAPRAGESLLWVLRDGKPMPVFVKLGLDDGEYSEILGGELKLGDRVIVERK